MALTICLTFVGATLLYALLGGLVCWRITRHLAGNPVATTAVVEHVLLPLFGRNAAKPCDPLPANLGVTCQPAWRAPA